MGLAYSPLALIVLREASPEAQGTATSALSLTDSLGTALGTGLTGRPRRGQPADDRQPGSRAGRRLRARRADRARRARAHRPAAATDRARRRRSRWRRRRRRRRRSRTPAVDFGRSHAAALHAAPPTRRARYRVCRGAAREDPRGPRLPEARDPVLRHHDAAQGRRRVQGGDRPDARALQGRADRHRGRDGVARVHLQRADGVPARRRASSRSASWASCRPRRSPSNTRSSTAPTRSRSTATRSRRVRRC